MTPPSVLAVQPDVCVGRSLFLVAACQQAYEPLVAGSRSTGAYPSRYSG